METTDTQQFKTVAKFAERMPAEILAGMLNENGIPAGVFGADSWFVGNGHTCDKRSRFPFHAQLMRTFVHIKIGAHAMTCTMKVIQSLAPQSLAS